MKQIIRDYLTFNKRERNGVFVLLAIIVALLIYLNFSGHFFPFEKINFSDFEKEITQLTFAAGSNDSINEHGRFVSEKKSPAKSERFFFDPNDLPADDWKRLGLSEKQVLTIKNYEAKGGKFKTKEDVKKMYCIRKELFVSLEPYIRIRGISRTENKKDLQESKPESALFGPFIRATDTRTVIELNSADSTMLTTLKGIGPFFAKAIIKYRNSLGGFVAKEQLYEVWKFDKEKFDIIEKYVSIDASLVTKININMCDAAQLKGPYVKWTVANAIVNYRDNHGKFKTIEDIRKTDLVDDETYRKIAPYLISE